MSESDGNYDFRAFANRVEAVIERFDSRFETVIERFDARFANIEKIQAEQGAIVSNLAKGQEGVYSRINRPFPWIVLGLIISVFSIGLGLVLTPLHSEQERQHSFDLTVMKELQLQAERNGRIQAELEWLKKLETRQNERVYFHLNGGTQ